MSKPINRSKFKTLSQIALVCFFVIMVVGTHLPPNSPLLPPEVNNLDKVYHCSAYGILALFLATTWQLAAGTLMARHLCWAWLGLVVWAAIDELTQIPVNRDCNIWDWTADAVGAALGLSA